MIRELALSNSINNQLVLSQLVEYNGVHEKKNFYSVKYVRQGKETYEIAGKIYEVHDDHYLLSGCDTTYNVFIASQRVVEGMCLFIPYAFLMDVYQNMVETQDFLLEYPHEKRSPLQLYQKVFDSQNNNLGTSLNTLYYAVTGPLGQFECVDASSVFYSLCEQILFSVKQMVPSQSKGMASRKTIKEVIRRLLHAKVQIDDEPEKSWNMAELSRSVGLSEFHFFRTFRKTFGISPYQYVIDKRMKLAYELLQEKKHAICEVAYMCGYGDLSSFSKAYKRSRTVSPSVAFKRKDDSKNKTEYSTSMLQE